MKAKRIFCYIAAVLFALSATAFEVYHPRMPIGDTSDLYKHYSDREGLEATFVKEFLINDTTPVDVTIVKANDTADWIKLVSDFFSDSLLAEINLAFPERQTVTFRYGYSVKDTHGKVTVSDSLDFVAAVWDDRTILVYHIDKKGEVDNIIHEQLSKHFNNKTKK